MQDAMTKEIDDLTKIRKVDAANIVSQAVKIGLAKLWNEMILDRYLSKKISRKEAIKLAGIDNVRTAEKQKKVILQDINWGLQHAR